MSVGRVPEQLDIKVSGTQLKQTSDFKYLGSIVNNSSDSTQDICSRIGMGRSTMTRLTKVWKSPISLQLKKRLVRSLVWSVVLHGCTTWAMKQSDEDRLEAFEMWCWRRMLRVRWIDRKSNTCTRCSR